MRFVCQGQKYTAGEWIGVRIRFVCQGQKYTAGEWKVLEPRTLNLLLPDVH